MAPKDKSKNAKDKTVKEQLAAAKKSNKMALAQEPTENTEVKHEPGDKYISVDNKIYTAELRRLQVELVKLQEWVRYRNLKVVVIFEGRDAAGKGGVIKRITESLNPLSVRKTNGISNATFPICPQEERWSCSIAAGTTAPAWKG
jgi:polyphosphate kinase 2 (PPK2 family)